MKNSLTFGELWSGLMVASIPALHEKYLDTYTCSVDPETMTPVVDERKGYTRDMKVKYAPPNKNSRGIKSVVVFDVPKNKPAALNLRLKIQYAKDRETGSKKELYETYETENNIIYRANVNETETKTLDMPAPTVHLGLEKLLLYHYCVRRGLCLDARPGT